RSARSVLSARMKPALIRYKFQKTPSASSSISCVNCSWLTIGSFHSPLRRDPLQYPRPFIGLIFGLAHQLQPRHPPWVFWGLCVLWLPPEGIDRPRSCPAHHLVAMLAPADGIRHRGQHCLSGDDDVFRGGIDKPNA